MNILIVDDETEYRLLLKDFLQLEGWTVFLAENGEDALSNLREHKIDFIISDIYMPVMDGLKFYQKAREIPAYQEVPFLFVSGYDDQYTLGCVKNVKTDGFFRKARPLSELKAWIQYLTTPLEKRPSSPPTQSVSRANIKTRSPEDWRPKRR